MISDITYAVSEMTSAVHAFNQKWPALVTNGCVWKIPLLDEPRAKSVIEPEVLLGQAAIDEAIKAIAAFYREPNQFPGTVMRLPGWFALRESVVPDLLHIQDLKQRIVDVIESTRLELNAPPYMRSNLLRSATSNNISQKQLIRCRKPSTDNRGSWSLRGQGIPPVPSVSRSISCASSCKAKPNCRPTRTVWPSIKHRRPSRRLRSPISRTLCTWRATRKSRPILGSCCTFQTALDTTP